MYAIYSIVLIVPSSKTFFFSPFSISHLPVTTPVSDAVSAVPIPSRSVTRTRHYTRDDSEAAVDDLRRVSSSFKVVVPLSLLLFFFFR